MDKQTIEKIIELSEKSNDLIEVHGIKHTYHSLEKVSKPIQDSMGFSCLSGLVDYVKKNKDGVNPKECIVHVVSHREVSLYGPVDPLYKTRPFYAWAEISNILKTFPFDTFLSYEIFMIKLLCLFETSNDLTNLIERISFVKTEDEQILVDTGANVQLEKRNSVKTKSLPGQENPFVVALKPFRTFAEVEQPESKFIFRLRKTKINSLPEIECALMECDGGVWVNEVRNSIKKYLSENLPPEIPIFA